MISPPTVCVRPSLADPVRQPSFDSSLAPNPGAKSVPLPIPRHLLSQISLLWLCFGGDDAEQIGIDRPSVVCCAALDHRPSALCGPICSRRRPVSICWRTALGHWRSRILTRRRQHILSRRSWSPIIYSLSGLHSHRSFLGCNSPQRPWISLGQRRPWLIPWRSPLPWIPLGCRFDCWLHFVHVPSTTTFFLLF
jgi:hypothetical protein